MPKQMRPGWYPDPSGQPSSRWWDGTVWTHHEGPPLSPLPRPRVGEGVSTSTVVIWIIALLPLLAIPLGLIPMPAIRFETIGPEHIREVDPTSIYTVGYLVTQTIGLALYAANVVLALLDHRSLLRRGVVRPFAWGWAFLAGVVYLIGRYVVVRRVAPGRSMWPLWVGLAVLAVGLAIGIPRSVGEFSAVYG